MNSVPPWREEPIEKRHDRERFDCGDPSLNDYLKRHARQSHTRGGAKTFLAVASGTADILGYYTLSPASLRHSRAPAVITRGLGRYDVPVFRLGRLAVDQAYQGAGLGGQLLLAAGRRCLRVAGEVGGLALLIDAKNEAIVEWYISYGAVPLDDSPLTLLLHLDTVSAALSAAETSEPL